MNLKRSMWDSLRDQYKNCAACPIGRHAKLHVFGRGSIHPEVLFIGEGPGKLEDLKGLPFVGQAGNLLTRAIRDTNMFRHCFFTNMVACRPCDDVGGINRAPSEQEIHNCSDRLKQTVEIMSPKVVVLLGRVAQKSLAAAEYLKKYKVFWMHHPAFILRIGGVKSPIYLEFVNKLKEVFNATVLQSV